MPNFYMRIIWSRDIKWRRPEHTHGYVQAYAILYPDPLCMAWGYNLEELKMREWKMHEL